MSDPTFVRCPRFAGARRAPPTSPVTRIAVEFDPAHDDLVTHAFFSSRRQAPPPLARPSEGRAHGAGPPVPADPGASSPDSFV